MEPFADNLTVLGALAGAVVGAVAGPVGAIAGAAIGGTAAHCLKKQQEGQSQQLTHREESGKSVPAPPSPLIQTPTVPRINKQCLLLVISATQAEFLDSLQAKRQIDMSDGERLYEITKYLGLGSATDFSESVREACINQYSVLKGYESEYDIYLVYIELNQGNEGFKPNINQLEGFEPNVNQLDRYDAFRNLAGLKINFISPRLQMEAYENFEVYNR